MRTDILERKEEILSWISEKKSKAYMARELQCNPKTITSTLSKMGINYNGNQGGSGTHKQAKKRLTLQEYLDSSLDIQSFKVKTKLLKEGYKNYCCESCGLTEWLNSPIPLELHHKDGNRHNNVLDNFMLLCPNCHAQTDSYRGKNCAK